MATITGDQNDNPNLVGTEFQDDIFGNGGDDVLNGLGSNDELFGGEGNDSKI